MAVVPFVLTARTLTHQIRRRHLTLAHDIALSGAGAGDTFVSSQFLFIWSATERLTGLQNFAVPINSHNRTSGGDMYESLKIVNRGEPT